MPHRPTLLAAVLAALALVAAAPAAAGVDDAGIELDGRGGRAVLSLRGAVLGSLDRGRITITVRRGDPEVVVQGFEWARPARDGGTTYGGANIRFRVFRGAWRVVVQANGIALSAVGRGIVGLRGDGRYSLDGGRYQPWPAKYETIRLGAYDRDLGGRRHR